jgi:predicted nuclease of predicted toxin-antitoxin system
VAKLLVDECLHTSLLELAHAAGHIADHVTYLGLASFKDRELVKLSVERDYIFVTNSQSHSLITNTRRE